MSLSIVVLTAIAGCAVDFGNWYLSADKLQKSADAASLAGAPYLPSQPGQAFAAATDLLIKNGFDPTRITDKGTTPSDPWDPTVAVAYTKSAYIEQDPIHPTQLKVTTHVKVHTVLLGLIGVNDEPLTRDSNGVFRTRVSMGSPSNVLGTEPAITDQATVLSASAPSGNSKFWLNISGGLVEKEQGDRYTSGRCTPGVADICNSTGVNPETGTGTAGNREHQYIVRIPKTVTSVVTLQVFDGAYVDVNDHCDNNTIQGFTYGQTLEAQPGILSAAAVANGYQPDLYNYGASSGFCTGDYEQDSPATAPSTTTFQVQKADPDEEPVGPGLVSGSGVKFPALSYPGYGGNEYLAALDLAGKLTANPPHSANNPTLKESFRRWYSVYTFTSPGTYIVTASNPAGSVGKNRFSMRVGIGDGTGFWNTSDGESDQISISAKHDLTVFTNSTGSSTSFYFAKLPNNTAGRKLTMELYDIGDVQYSVDVQLVPPTGAIGFPTGTFSSCIQNGPWAAPVNLPNCVIPSAAASSYNGKLVKLTLDVPHTYRCTDVGDGCWMTIRFNLNGGGAFTPSAPSDDTTTWQVDDCGNPDKIIKKGDDETACMAAF